MKNLHAYTEPGHEYPAYISINQDEHGAYFITVRSRGQMGFQIGSVEMTEDNLRKMAEDTLASLPARGA